MATPRDGPRSAGDDAFDEAGTLSEPRRPRAENAYNVAPGTLLCGKYRVVRTLGRGGMGIVVEAFHLELQVPVAIKLLLPAMMDYAEAASRFQREARAVTRLTSEHVARVLDVDTLPSGEPFIVMEFLKGQDLAQRGKEPIPLGVGEAIDCVVQACDAIAEAHSIGIVHRDLKPANLFLAKRPGGEVIVKVLDFGISKVLTGNGGEVSITQTTTILGSALYMSPEQMRSARDVDARTDVYALGACLYEMLARRPPYLAGSFPELCAAVFSGPPMPITEWSPDVPEGLAKVIDKALAHERDARYADIAEFVQALAPFAQEGTRARIEAILRRHAPHLSLPPPARKRRTLDPVFESTAEEPAPRRGGRWVVPALLLLGLLGAGVAFRSRLPFGLSRGGAGPGSGVDAAITGSAQSGGLAAPGSAAGAAGPGSAAGSAGPGSAAGNAAVPGGSGAPGQASAAPNNGPPTGDAAPAAARASAVAASASGAAKGTSSSAGGKPPSPDKGKQATSTAGQPFTTSPSPGQAPSPSPSTVARPGSPVINPDLSDRTCFAIQPDGSRKEIPCN
jgi:serine/threonine-protein kinase